MSAQTYQAESSSNTTISPSADHSSSDDEYDVDASIPSTPFQDDEPDALLPSEELGVDGNHTDQMDDSSREKDETPAGKTCRICFGGAEEEVELGRLISPCLCSGSMRYVHLKCLDAWRGTGTNAKAFLECPQCRYQYRLKRTLISGLATSKPVLLLLTTLLFTALTLTSGSILHYFLLPSSPTPTVTTSKSLSLTRYLNPLNTYLYDDLDSPYLYYTTSTSSPTLIWDILTTSISAFTNLSSTLNPTSLPFYPLIIRFILGLSLLGSISFISLLLSLSLLAPLQIANNLRTSTFLRRRGGNGGEGGGSVGQVLVVIMVGVGVVRTVMGVYGAVRGITGWGLRWVESRVLEVGNEEREEVKERERRERGKWWGRRWVEEGRWRGRDGWKEVGVRGWIAVRNWWEGWKAGWTGLAGGQEQEDAM